MNFDGLREAIRTQPFQPFTICLADGRSEFVRHPEFVAVGPRLVVVVREDNSWLSIEPLMIVSLDYDVPGSRKAGNGTPKKRRRGS
jgi:hypothetical protein